MRSGAHKCATVNSDEGKTGQRKFLLIAVIASGRLNFVHCGLLPMMFLGIERELHPVYPIAPISASGIHNFGSFSQAFLIISKFETISVGQHWTMDRKMNIFFW